MAALVKAAAVDHAAALHRRCCDFWLVDGEIELVLKTPAPKSQTQEPTTAKSVSRKLKIKKNAA